MAPAWQVRQCCDASARSTLQQTRCPASSTAHLDSCNRQVPQGVHGSSTAAGAAILHGCPLSGRLHNSKARRCQATAISCQITELGPAYFPAPEAAKVQSRVSSSVAVSSRCHNSNSGRATAKHASQQLR